MLGDLRAAQKVNGVSDFGQEVVPLATGGIIYGNCISARFYPTDCGQLKKCYS